MDMEKIGFGDGQPSSEVVDLRGILLLLRRQLRLIVLTSALLIGAALVYLITATPMYTARTLLMIDPSQRNLLDSDQFTSSSAQTDNAKIDSEVEIIRSPSTTLAVIDAAGLITDDEFGPSVGFVTRMKIALGVQSDAPPSRDMVLQDLIQRLDNATTVRRMGMTYLVSVDVTSKDASRAAVIANAVANTYIRNQVQAKINASLSARDVLQEQADAGREGVAASDAALDGFIEENLAALEEDAGNPRIAELRASLESQRAQLLSQEEALRAVSTGLAERNFAALADSLANDAISELVTQRETIAAQLQSAGTGSPELVDLQAELAKLEGQIESAATESLTTLQGSVNAQNGAITGLRTELRSTLLQSDLSSQSLARIFELQQAASNARSQYQNVLARISEIENQAAVQVAQSRVVSEALPPSQKSSPNTRLILAMALIAGIGLGVGIAFLNEYYIGGIVTPAQLEQVTGLQVATVVPKISDSASLQKGVAAAIVQDPMSSYAESIRRLRAVLDQDLRRKFREWHDFSKVDDAHEDGKSEESSSPKQRPRQGSVIMVTSSVPAEGKSTLSLSLARVYALTDLKVIIVDADLRKPSIAGLLEIEPDVGLLDFLMKPSEDEVTAKFSIMRDPLSSLHCILGTGRAKVPTDQLLSSRGFVSIIERLKKNYDIIIIDTAPLLPVVDARYVAHHADAVVMPVRWAATSQGDLRGAIAMLKPAIGNDVHVHLVLNHNEQAAGGYGYGYRYSGYYGE
jgi:succinoglycan biosynthesis transport protein ExoP